MAAAFETSFDPVSVTFVEAGETETINNVDGGTGANRLIVIPVLWRFRANPITAVRYNGVAASSLGARIDHSGGVLSFQAFALASPASGLNPIAIDISASSGGDSPAIVGAIVINGVDVGGTPYDGYNSNQGSAVGPNTVSSLTAAMSSVDGDRILALFASLNINTTITGSASAYTEREDFADANGFAMQFGDANGAASVNPQCTWSNGAFNVDWIAIGLNVNQSAGSAPAEPPDRKINEPLRPFNMARGRR